MMVLREELHTITQQPSCTWGFTVMNCRLQHKQDKAVHLRQSELPPSK
jgi:hypothetical protein